MTDPARDGARRRADEAREQSCSGDGLSPQTPCSPALARDEPRLRRSRHGHFHGVWAVLEFQPAPELAARIEDPASKSTEGWLTDAEREEYEGYVRANKFISILQRLWSKSSNGPARNDL